MPLSTALPRLLLQCRPGTVGLIATAVLAGCAVGPGYVVPAMDVPVAYKEAGPWKTATPQSIDSHQNWWEIYSDATLDGLIQQADQSNQTIRQAEAQYRQARAVAAQARAGFWPTATLNGGASRGQSNTNGIKLGNEYDADLTVGWEPDLWGRIRHSVEAGTAQSQASEADLAAARLSIQTLLAQDYLQFRMTQRLEDLYARTTAAYQRALALTQSQYAAGIVLRSDVALAQSQLSAAQAQALDLQIQHSQLEHAIAILTGKLPAAFSLAAPAPETKLSPSWPVAIPDIPTGVPSDLLERRPDIAGAERRVAAANANVGVARAAYFPNLTLVAGGGFSAATLAEWFTVPGRVWSLGATLAQTLFDGGLRRAQSEEAIAIYDATVAQYKQTVLNGFQQVEDNLAALSLLDAEAIKQSEAVQAAHTAEQLALAQYRGGTVTYLSVVTAQTLSLTNERTLVQLQGRQLVASVALINAVGGGWDAHQLASSQLTTPSAAVRD